MSASRGRPPLPLAPVLHKTGSQGPWPADQRMFYVLARNGLFRCRNHEFFRSCVAARRGPSQLEDQETFLEPSFPRLPRSLIEQIVGFFDRVAELHGSEAAALLVWDRAESRVRVVVPEQTATMSVWGGYRSPVGVHYQLPRNLPLDWVPFGDIHSHVHHAAYSSSTDRHDELHSAGLHLVVGRIGDEPPEFHAEAVVDGTRFPLELAGVIEDYRARDTQVPQGWIEQVRVEALSSVWRGASAS